MRIFLESLGCCRNQVDSEVMLGRLASRGHSVCNDPSRAHVIIINTCGFIAAASAEAVDTILEMARYRKTGLCGRIIVTGCLPERFRDDTLVEALPEVDAFLGTGACDDIVAAVEDNAEDKTMVLLPDPCARMFQGYPLPRVLSLGYSAFVKISEGCNRKCTYCIIPKLRGIQRSRPVKDIVQEIQYLFSKNIREIVLIGENTTDYGTDLTPPVHLSHLLRHVSLTPDALETDHCDLTAGPRVSRTADGFDGTKSDEISLDKTGHKKTSTTWIRLLYTHPDSMDNGVIKAIANLPNICTYYDVPVQHASSKILKKMGRNYNREYLYRLFHAIREADPDAVLRTTLITGFPGETDADFQELLTFINDIRFDNLGVFSYSDSEDLASHHLKDHVSEEIAEQRHDTLMARQAQISEEINRKYLGQTLKVLVEENPDEGLFLGRTWFQAPEVDGITFIYGSGLEIGTFVDVKITQTHEYDLTGECR